MCALSILDIQLLVCYAQSTRTFTSRPSEYAGEVVEEGDDDKEEEEENEKEKEEGGKR